MTSDRLTLSEIQKDILRRYAHGGVTKGMLAQARRHPELVGQSGYTFLTAAVEMLDAGYFVEPTRRDIAKSATQVRDERPAELTEFGEQERLRLEREDWR